MADDNIDDGDVEIQEDAGKKRDKQTVEQAKAMDTLTDQVRSSACVQHGEWSCRLHAHGAQACSACLLGCSVGDLTDLSCCLWSHSGAGAADG